MKPSKIRREDALAYHSSGRKGKIEVVSSKPCATQRDLSLAYTPGVADPCLAIADNPDLAYQYTTKGNLVAVVSNGTAVLGLGNIGPLAGKPVMEGKGVLFKRFADIDVFDIELDANSIDTVVTVVKSLEPTFGGINLEDIKAPECFIIEQRLKEMMSIPVFHDDQHGTAIISGAALINALEVVGKRIESAKIVVSGAGASAIACANFYQRLGVRRENITLVDTKGVIYRGRGENMNQWKDAYAQDTKARTLAEAVRGADVFLGCSTRGVLSQDMVRSMAKDPIVFALANPEPEIEYTDAVAARDDLIIATGRSDYPNQVNNVLGFPFIFRGALDTRASAINEEMKLAAAHALAALAKEDVPETVTHAYGGQSFTFGRNYIIPKPFDPRVLLWVAPAVAKAAMDTGVARQQLDLVEYRESLKKRVSRGYSVMSTIYAKAKSLRKTRLIFPEGEHPKILQAAQILQEDGICEPVLVGNEHRIAASIEEHMLDDLEGVTIVDSSRINLSRYVDALFSLRQRRGMTLAAAQIAVQHPNTLATLMLALGEVDGMVTGLTMSYPDAVRAPLQIIQTREGKRAASVYLLVFKNDFKFLADCAVNACPSAQELAEIAVCTAKLARYFDVRPRVAMLSYSNFGSADGESPRRMHEAVAIARRLAPELEIDGEMQADPALDPELMQSVFPFSCLKKAANVLIFPNLDAANIAYKLLWHLGGAEVIGPVLLNMNKPVNVLQLSASVSAIVHLAAMTALRAQGDEFVY